jgi:hypothetical protein
MRNTIFMKRKIVGAVISAALIATAFSPGSCTISVNEDLLSQLTSWLDGLDASGTGLPGSDMFVDGPLGGQPELGE